MTAAGDFNGWGPDADHLQHLGSAAPREVYTDTTVEHRTSQTFSLHSDIMSNTHTVTVYLPAAFDTTQRYRVLYTHDGPDYRTLLHIHNVADYLSGQGEVPPFIVVTVPWVNPPGREGEYHMNPNFARFFVEELIPYVDAHYRTLASREGRAIVGESSADLGAVYLAWEKPGYFQHAIGQSGYYWFSGDALMDSISAAQQRLAATLTQKGYDHPAIYAPDGHSWGNWQRTIGDAIRWMW